MVGRTTPRRVESLGPITWGTVRGHDIHLACATEEETLLTWGRFAPQTKAPLTACYRCGAPLNGEPNDS